jgi:hypothetical protein
MSDFYQDLSEVSCKTISNLCKSSTTIHFQEHPRRLIPELCKQMYHQGWVTGTGMILKLTNQKYEDLRLFL